MGSRLATFLLPEHIVFGDGRVEYGGRAPAKVTILGGPLGHVQDRILHHIIKRTLLVLC